MVRWHMAEGGVMALGPSSEFQTVEPGSGIGRIRFCMVPITLLSVSFSCGFSYRERSPSEPRWGCNVGFLLERNVRVPVVSCDTFLP